MSVTALVKDRSRSFNLSHDRLYFTHQETDFGNPLWCNAAYKVLIVRLSPYNDVAESRPHMFLFDEVRRTLPDSYIDFAFFPRQRDISNLEKAKLPWLSGVSSGQGAADFDILLVSNAFTLELVNLLPALTHSGIPGRRSLRASRNFPYILLGGSNALASGALLDITEGTAVDAIPDGFFFGEGEHITGALVAAILSLRAANVSGNTIDQAALFELAHSYKGFYPIGYSGSVEQATFRNSKPPSTLYPLLAGENTNTVRMEISAGCPSFCTFCFESWERKPYREYDLSSLINHARELKALSGAETLELSSYNFNTHTDIAKLIQETNLVFKQVNFMSQRVDILAEHPELVDFEIAGGKRSFTLGVEGISEGMRSYYNKELSFEEIKVVFARLLKHKVREIKLFYIISGLETDEDLQCFEHELSALAALVSGAGYTPSLLLSAGLLIRMPFTPLGFERPILDEATFTNISKRIDCIAKEQGFESRSPYHFDEYLVTQILALAPEGAFSLLESLYRAGIILDGSLPKKTLPVLESWLQGHHGIVDSLLKEKSRDYSFTFSNVQRPVSNDFLFERYSAAKARRAMQSCFRLSKHESACNGCEACRDPKEREALLHHTIKVPGYKETEALRAQISMKQRLPAFLYRYRIPHAMAFAPAQYLEAQLMKRLFALAPKLVDSVYSARDVMIKKMEEDGKLRNASGESLVCFYAREAPAPEIAEALKLLPYEESFTPQSPESLLKTIHLAIHTYADEQGCIEKALAEFFDTASIPFTLRRIDGGAEFLISDKGKKKKNITAARITKAKDGSCTIIAECGAKVDLREFVRLVEKRDIRLSMQVDSLGLD